MFTDKTLLFLALYIDPVPMSTLIGSYTVSTFFNILCGPGLPGEWLTSSPLERIFHLQFIQTNPHFHISLKMRPIFDDRLKEQLFVCLCVCKRATEHTFWLIFSLFEIFIFTLFIGIFQFFPYITLVIFLFQATGHSFSCRNMIFGLREPCTIGNWRLLTFSENSIFYG